MSVNVSVQAPLVSPEVRHEVSHSLLCGVAHSFSLSFPAVDSHRNGVLVTLRCGFVCTVIARIGVNADVDLAVLGTPTVPTQTPPPPARSFLSPAFIPVLQS